MRKPATKTHSTSLLRQLPHGGDFAKKTDMVVRHRAIKYHEAHIYQVGSNVGAQKLNAVRVNNVKDAIIQTQEHMWNVHSP